MKTSVRMLTFTSASALLVAALLAASPLHAQGGPPPHAGKGVRAAAAASAEDDLAALERFLSLSDAELDRLQQAIARVRAMDPAERAALRERMLAYRRLPAPQRDDMRLGWGGWENEQDRTDWPMMMHALSVAERDAIRAEILALPPHQRPARKHAVLEEWRQRTRTKP